MDDTTTLVSELLDKLAGLNQKVHDYRQDMVQEFQRYRQRLLHDAPEHISARVEEVLAAELHNYPALSPGFAQDATSTSADLCHSAVDRWGRHGRSGASPPPPLPHTSGVPPNPKDPSPPTSPNGGSHDGSHDGSPPSSDSSSGDSKVRGLFSSTYLPLLDVMQPIPATSAPTVISSPPVTSQDNDSNHTQAPPPQPDAATPPRRPDTIRRYTEETTTSSVNSDDSVSRTPRSALRRSSSASVKDVQSPRRVRFDVEGEEVLPTVSPPASPRVYGYGILKSPPPEEQFTSTFYESLNQVAFGEDASLFGSSPPRPKKKLSSTERLRALARSSTEDTSKWTVVGDTHDDDEEDEGLVMSSSKKKPTSPVPGLRNGTSSHDTHDTQVESSNNLTKEIRNDQDVRDVVPEATPDEKPQRPPSNETKLPSPALDSQPHPPESENREEEDMFKFDDEGGSASEHQAVANKSKYIEEEEEEEEEVEVRIRPRADNAAEESRLSLYSTSPAIPIMRPMSLQAEAAANRIGATSGSYKGKPFMLGAIRDRELYKKAEGMGAVYTFVGSIDGRTGVDPSDNFRPAPSDSLRQAPSPFYSPGLSKSLDSHHIAHKAHKQVSNAADRID